MYVVLLYLIVQRIHFISFVHVVVVVYINSVVGRGSTIPPNGTTQKQTNSKPNISAEFHNVVLAILLRHGHGYGYGRRIPIRNETIANTTVPAQPRSQYLVRVMYDDRRLGYLLLMKD